MSKSIKKEKKLNYTEVILFALKDLHKQATSEHSHFYTAKTLQLAINLINTLKDSNSLLEQTLKVLAKDKTIEYEQTELINKILLTTSKFMI